VGFAWYDCVWFSITLADEPQAGAHEGKSDSVANALRPRPAGQFAVQNAFAVVMHGVAQTVAQAGGKGGVLHHHIGFTCQEQAQGVEVG